MELSPLRQLRMGQLAKMVSWYDPRLLARIGVRTIISSVFGQYADQRLIQAVTDLAEDKELIARYDYSDPAPPSPAQTHRARRRRRLLDRLRRRRRRRLRGHLHDGLPARPGSLDVRGAGRLRHGEILIMGGDQCYPQATREEYKKRLISPSTGRSRCTNPDRKLFAIPGNHDWYDGLASFDSLFCSARDRAPCQGQRDRRLAVPAASQLLGAPPALQLVDLGRRHPVLEVPRHRPGQLLRGSGRRRWGRRQSHHLPRRPSWLLAELDGEDEEENFFKITTIAREGRARGRRDCGRLAPLRSLFRPRAGHAFHHLGWRRRVPAPHARAQERHLSALAGTARTRCRSPRNDRASGQASLGNPRIRHPSQA